jgi:outer membrane protein OmpA-like peptidoglycan-associated protein
VVGGFVDTQYVVNSNFPANHIFRGTPVTARTGEFSPNLLVGYVRKDPVAGCAILRPTLVLRGINFAVDSAEIQPDSFPVLDNVARILADNPDVRVEIGGHTDATGGRAHNMRLSQARAESVVNYMVSRGVDRARLDARGYGPTQPVASNDTEEGKAQNRRIEFRRLDQAPEGAGGAEGGGGE